MRRIAIAALLAVPLLLAGAGQAAAGPGPFGTFGCASCIKLFPHIHQHGPLYNYGPYYGYPPFEPYGYWNPYLQYTGPVGPQYTEGHSHNFGHRHGNLHPLFGHGLGGVGCHSCGHRGVISGKILHGGLGGWHKGGHHGCTSCGEVAAVDASNGYVFNRYTGYGDPAASAAYYHGTPSLTDPEAVMPAGFADR